jgi:hypothetical protein
MASFLMIHRGRTLDLAPRMYQESAVRRPLRGLFTDQQQNRRFAGQSGGQARAEPRDELSIAFAECRSLKHKLLTTKLTELGAAYRCARAFP